MLQTVILNLFLMLTMLLGLSGILGKIGKVNTHLVDPLFFYVGLIFCLFCLSA